MVDLLLSKTLVAEDGSLLLPCRRTGQPRMDSPEHATIQVIIPGLPGLPDRADDLVRLRS
jgi:hypothetical protein